MIGKSKEQTGEGIIEKFGRMVAERFAQSLEQVDRALEISEVSAHIEVRKFLAPLSPRDREIKIAQIALEYFIHEFMASLNESHDFRIMGRREDRIEIDIRDLCPEGLHGNQFDWIEENAGIKSI